MIKPVAESVRSRLLQKRVEPASPMSLHRLGISVTPRDDVVLKHLAQSDEREYQKMFDTSNAISGAIEQRRNGLISKGSEVVVGPSGSDNARRLQEFTVVALKGIPQFNTLLREMLMSIFYGWRPVRLDWHGELIFEGRPHFGIEKATAEKPWHYQFTTDGKLVFFPRGAIDQVKIFDQPEDEFRWVICTSGSTSSRYGESWLRRMWLLYFVSKQFERMSSQAQQRALGLIKMSYDGAGDFSGAPDETELESSLAQVMDKLTANNILLETQGWSFEVIQTAQLSKSHKDFMTYFDDKLTRGIVGQNLTSQVTGGSFAAAQVHEDVLETFWMSDARELQDWVNDQIIERLVVLNFGVQLNEDMPRWRSAIFSDPDIDIVRLFMDYGGQVDGKRLADVGNVPMIQGEPEEGDVVLEKQQAPSPIIAAQAAPADDAPANAARSSAAAAPSAPWDEATIQRDFAAVDTALDDAVDEAIDASRAQAGAYFGDISTRLLEANPDPKAAGPSE